MPIYEYVCGDCGTHFEKILQRYEDTTDCLHCRSNKVTRQFSSFAVGSSAGASTSAAEECGPCGCGAPRPGMCSMN